MSVRTDLGVFRAALATARADLGAIYTWKSWTGGWLLRVLAQVAFFGLIGRLLGSAETARYLAVGNAVGIAVLESMQVVASTSWERNAGTLPLLVAAPGRLFVTFIGRSLLWVADGTACASIAFFLVGAWFGVALGSPSILLVIPLILLVSLATYAFGLVVAAIVLRSMTYRNVASNLGYLSLFAVTGIQVPLSFWPAWVRAIAQFLPATHGLSAIRTVVGHGSGGRVVTGAALEIAVGLGWLLVAGLAFTLLAESGRRDGSIEFS